MKKKMLSLALAIVLVASLAACAPTNNAPASQAPSGAATADSTAKPTDPPPADSTDPEPEPSAATSKIFETPTEITYFCADENGEVPVTEDLWMFQKITELTGVKFKLIVAPIANYDEKLGTIIASSDLPDLMALRKANENTKLYGPQGAFVDYMPYVNEGKMPNFKAKMDGVKDSYTMASTADGAMYEAPRIYDYTWTTESFIMRQDILEELGLAMPQTTEEFYAALKAMKEKYPDSTPFTNKWGADHVLAGFSRAFGTFWDLYPDDSGTWSYGPMEPAYKDMLAYLANMYKDGLLDKEFATLADAAMKEKVVNGISFATYNYLGEGYANTNEAIATNPNFMYHAIPMLSTNGKSKGAEVLHSAYVQFGKAISAKSKYIDQLIQYVDWTYTLDGALVMQYGDNGVHYNLADEKFSWIPPYDELTERHKLLIGNQNVLSVATAYGQQADPEITQKSREIVLSGPVDKAIPIVTLTNTEDVSALLTPIRTYVQENAVKVITGSMPVEKWDEVIAQVQKYKVDEVLSSYQSAYDATFK